MRVFNTLFSFGYLLMYCISMQGQQLPLFSQYRENQSILNPAALSINYIRSDYNFTAGISRRNQWGGTKLLLDNGDTENFGPSTTTGRVEWVFPEDRFFVGGYVMNDNAGAIELTGVYLRAGYLILDPEDSYFGLVGSINGGFNQFRVDFFKGGLFDYNTQYTDVDAGLGFKTNYFDYSIGFFGWGEVASGFFEGDMVYAGVSLPQMRGLPLNQLHALQDAGINEENFIQLSVFTGLYKSIGGQTFLEGSMNFNKLINHSKTPFVINTNIRAHYQDWGWVGGGVKFPISDHKDQSGRTFDEVVNENGLGNLRNLSDYSVTSLLFEVGFNIGKNINEVWDPMNFKLGVGYEIPIGGLLAKLGNTLELNITYTLDTTGGRR